MPFSEYAPHLMGRAELRGGSDFEAGSFVEFEVVYHVGALGIDDNGSVKIAFRTTNDNGGIQFKDPAAPGYTTITCSGHAKIASAYERFRNIRPWSRSIYMQVTDGFLRPGDTITVKIGDRSGGSPGFRVQTFCEFRSPIKVFVDALATYDYVELPSSPIFSVHPGMPANWKAVLPSLGRTGEQFQLRLKVEDRWGNPSNRAETTLKLRPSRSLAGLPEETTFAYGQFATTIDALSTEEEGPLWIDLIGVNGQILARSNPIQIVRDPSRQHFWGDLHHQTNETAGTNTIRDMFRFARDLGFLDISSHQGNDFQITDAFWADLNNATREFNEEGRFLAIPGYEWSGNTAVGGDRNVWFRHEGERIRRSSRVLVADRADEIADCHTTNDLFTALKGVNAVVAAHCGGRFADIGHSHDGRLEHSVEIHSAWGTFEWLLHEAFDKGYRVGIVANSDGHKGRPGAAYPGASQFGSRGGLTCFLAAELTRDAIFDAMRSRHHFATSGGRAYLDVAVELPEGSAVFDRDPAMFPDAQARPDRTAIMGDIVRLGGKKVRLQATILGSVPLERVELRDGRDILKSFRPYQTSDLGSRIRVIWSGARYRGRNRAVKWNGSAAIKGNEIVCAKSINFLNTDQPLQQDSKSSVSWRSTTTGSFCGIDLWLAHPQAGSIAVTTPEITQELAIDSIGFHDQRFEVGPIDRALRFVRLPDKNSGYEIRLSEDIAVESGKERRIFISAFQEDGTQAWSSPIYLLPEA